VTVAELDALAAPTVRELLLACCGAAPWIDSVMRARPWHDRAGLMSAAAAAWRALEPGELAAAVARHPRLGGTQAAVELSARERRWSAAEQAGAGAADEAARDALASGNVEYERRFGHTFILCAAGRSASDMLAALRARLANDPATELAVTGAELWQITLSRLEKLLAGA
jgi:2-oxo-4-hydroxy-4-carboxy-5-ureidoimidazoline decarboxylase